ncbi:heavy metal-binding domain-containing protein [Pontibacillus yanchengensis]|uniref:Heavy metal-binding domain-containing protein n=2 Tax=Pontibacillus yanchengensis TaxID=462910 RepID=A0ACC7VK94_9BACI|nr:YbjQ family protein [Pontibacillus yanchengensis]MYL32793.1 heavy metal-binding domain-containing protein [Pontibacillus yanchengensis]MYL55187.1 heavy metal-binding domain-containing protein [Pontibacillus yanchengensis]
MIIVTTDFIPGYDIQEIKGFVRGSTVQSKNVGRDILASLKNIVGGEIVDYTKMMDEARQKAIGRMKDHAEEKGADAIIAVRLETSSVTNAASEIIAYGTAVTLTEQQ